jgi:hypothetical protein
MHPWQSRPRHRGAEARGVRPGAHRPAFRVAVGATALACTFFLGRATSPGRPARSSPAQPQQAAEPDHQVDARRAPRPAAPVPRLAPAAVEAAPDCEPADRRGTATFLVSSLLRRLDRRQGAPGEFPETSANAIRLYVQGVADTVKQTSPAVRAALAEEFTTRLCEGALADDELITMANLGLELPDITSPRAFDCVFARRGAREDVVLWSMLDAWRHSGQDRTAAVADVERSATDPRTQRRFLSQEAEMALRGGSR